MIGSIQFGLRLSAAPLFAIMLSSLGCGSDNGTSSHSSLLEYERDYCDMEASCIPRCSCLESECPCSSKTRQLECGQDYKDWVNEYTRQGEACKVTLLAWTDCITNASCGGVEIFFRGHPDGVLEGDPCASEYFELECNDFEPPIEYAFDD